MRGVIVLFAVLIAFFNCADTFAAKKERNPRKTYNPPETVEEYEERARAINRAYSDTPKVVTPKDTKIIDLPEPYVGLAKYNDPPGTKEIDLSGLIRSREVKSPGVATSDGTKLVYSSVYYYPDTNHVASEVYMIPLDTSLSLRKRVSTAHISKRKKTPLLTAGMDKIEKDIQRTLTVIDYSLDGKKLAVKEKTGSRKDGIWETQIWVFDFEKSSSKRLDSALSAVKNFWKTQRGIDLGLYRWDIYPLGWDASDSGKILYYAYGYTGERPVFLGTWSVDAASGSVRQKSLYSTSYPVSVNGLMLEAKNR